MARKLIFVGDLHVTNWLLNHQRGRAVLDACLEMRCQECDREKKRVLIRVHADGGIVVSHDRGVAVKIIDMLDVPEDGEGAEPLYLDTLAEDYARACLPPDWRHLISLKVALKLYPDCRTAGEELERLWKLDWLKAFRELGKLA